MLLKIPYLAKSPIGVPAAKSAKSRVDSGMPLYMDDIGMCTMVVLGIDKERTVLHARDRDWAGRGFCTSLSIASAPSVVRAVRDDRFGPEKMCMFSRDEEIVVIIAITCKQLNAGKDFE